MTTVMTAQYPDSHSLSSTGNAAYMLIRQENFPYAYDQTRDKYTQADHDRVQMQRGDEFRAWCDKWLGCGEMAIPSWAKSVDAKDFVRACAEMLGADEAVTWTGARILGTVNRGNGHSVFSGEVFALGEGSSTKVYSGPNAPNVKQERSLRSNYYDRNQWKP